MPAVVVDIAKPPDACWRALTDATLFPAWMPGLRRVAVISTEPDGLPHEVQFEFSVSLTYSLLYSYDRGQRVVRWESRTGARDGVRGSARIDANGEGSHLTYALEQGSGRVAGDIVLGGAHAIVGAFVRWIEAR